MATNVFPSCGDCHQHRLDRTSGCGCADCCDWGHEQNPRLLAVKPPANFPISETDRNGNVHPCKLSCDLLKSNCEKAHDKHVNDEWSGEEAASFLEQSCINKSLATPAMLERAKNCHQLKNCRDESTIVELEFLKSQDPSLFLPWSPPVSGAVAAVFLIASTPSCTCCSMESPNPLTLCLLSRIAQKESTRNFCAKFPA